MLNARSNTIGMHSAFRLDGFTRARELGPCQATTWRYSFATQPPFEAAVHWVFTEDADATYNELKSLGANIVEPLEKKPWGLRQFTVDDLDRNRSHFHHD